MGEFNIAPNTQIGRINIPETVYSGENAYNIEESKYSRGGEFIENLVTDNMIEYCHRWFHLANIEEFLEDMDEYYTNNSIGSFSNLDSVFSPIRPTSSPIRDAVRFENKTAFSPVTFYDKRNEDYNYNNLSSKGGIIK